MDGLANAIRLLVIIIGTIVAGAMMRFYWSRRGAKGMPSSAMIAFFLMSVHIFNTTWENWNRPWHWGESPIALLAYLFTFIGVYPYLQFKHLHLPHGDDKSPHPPEDPS